MKFINSEREKKRRKENLMHDSTTNCPMPFIKCCNFYRFLLMVKLHLATNQNTQETAN
jgi:hypothetical protein